MSEVLPNGVEIDADSVRFSGSARLILRQLVMKAKFDGEPNGDVMFNPWLSVLLEHLEAVAERTVSRGRSENSPREPYADDPKTRFEISRMIAGSAAEIGWWGMTRPEQGEYLRKVVASPRQISDATVEEIILSVDEYLDALERVLAARGKGRGE